MCSISFLLSAFIFSLFIKERVEQFNAAPSNVELAAGKSTVGSTRLRMSVKRDWHNEINQKYSTNNFLINFIIISALNHQNVMPK